MSAQEPAWRKRTRPCPFYSQGRCLFADSCNFLHDVKVRKTVDPLLLACSGQIKQQPFPLKPVSGTPSVVVDSASPRLSRLAGPEGRIASSIHDSSRYSGLISLLSDVIGPPSSVAEDTDAGSRTVSPVASGSQSATHSCDDVTSDSNAAVTNVQPTSVIVDMGMDLETQHSSGSAELFSVLPSDGEDTLVNPFGSCQKESFPPEAHSSIVVERLLDPEPEESYEGNATSYFVEEAVREMQEEGSDGDEDSDEGENPTVVMSDRQSTFSTFTGASLLASPQNDGIAAVTSPIECAANILSPVEMSAKLQPFPIPSSGPKLSRGDSIDSGYADGDNWVSPIPFPRSPPRSFRSSAIFLSHLRRASRSSIHKDGGSGVPGLFPRPIEAIKEVDSSGTSAGAEDAAFTILDAYDTSCSEKPHLSSDPSQLDVAIADIAEEDGELSEEHAVTCGPWRHCPEYLYPAREYDLDSCNQSSFVSDDNMSFKTALSTQPSFEDFNQIPHALTANLSSVAGQSTSLTMLLHYDDASEYGQHPIVDSDPRDFSCPIVTTSTADQIDSPLISEFLASEERRPPDGSSIGLNSPFAPAGADDLQELSPQKVVTPRVPLSVFPFDKPSSVTSLSMDAFHELLSDEDFLGDVLIIADNVRELAQDKVVTPRESSFDVCGFDDHSTNTNLSTKISQGSPSIINDALPYDAGSPGPSPLTESCDSQSPYGGILTSAAEDTSVVQELASDHVGASPKRSPAVSECEQLSLEQSSLIENCGSPSLAKDTLRPAFLEAGCEDCRLTDPSSCFVDDTLESDAFTESFSSDNSGGNNFTQPLPFPLPPLSLPIEFTDHSPLDGNLAPAAISEAAVANLEGDVLEGSTVFPHAALQRLRSGSDMTEKARPSQLPSTLSSDFAADFITRSRAASDLTVKGKLSPVTPLGDTSYVLEPLSPAPEQPSRPDHARSLSDQRFDEDPSDDPEVAVPGSVQGGTVPADASELTDEPSQDITLRSLDFASQTFRRVLPQCHEGKSSASSTDLPPPETVFRPLLTGRRSFLRPSLAELIPKVDFVSPQDHCSPIQRARLQTREIGSTMVPLGFRRHKPQTAATHSLRNASQPSYDALPAVSELRQALRIRTDLVKEGSSRECYSASHVLSATRSPLPVTSMSAPPTGGLKELHLSSVINKRSSILSTHSSSIVSSILSLDHIFNSSTPQSPSVSSASSFSCHSLLSSSREQIPEQARHTLKRTSSHSLILQPQSLDDIYSTSQSSLTRRDSRSVSAPTQQPTSWRLSHYRAGSRNYDSTYATRRYSRRTSTLSLSYVVDAEQDVNQGNSTAAHPVQSRNTDEWSRPSSVLVAPAHAIATPKPTLLFAIASDDVNRVHQVLESGEAGPNDSVGPQSALAFTLTNDKLIHKQEIVKALLAYGANPSALRNPALNPAPHKEGGEEPSAPPLETTLEGMDPATRYFVSRADAPHTRQTSKLIHRSFFRPLTRVRYDVIGQDWALEQLFRVLGMHSQKLAVAPIVVLLCGPSGHGKSLLARKFGSLLGIPTHTVNMTTLQSAHDIWQSYSMSPYEEPSSCTLAEFLIENEGKRCVVVLDEIEKVEDQKVLWSLLMPWELGQCSWEAGKRHVDVRNVIWLGTSNIGHELVFEHCENRAEPDSQMSREDYLGLTDMLRPCVSHCLGPSLVSRVTTVLPFVPFTLDEKKAIAAEAVYALGSNTSKILSPQDVESVVARALTSYRPSEGARSLHRAVSSNLADAI